MFQSQGKEQVAEVSKRCLVSPGVACFFCWGSFTWRWWQRWQSSSLPSSSSFHYSFSLSLWIYNISSSRESSGWTCSTNLNMKWNFIIVDKHPGTSPVVWTCFLVLRWMLTLVFVDLQHMLTLIIFATLERIFMHLHAFVFCKCLTTSYGWGKVCKESLKVLETTPLLGD